MDRRFPITGHDQELTLERVASFHNLFEAHKKAARGCPDSNEILEFDFHLEKKLLALKMQLLNGSYIPAFPRYFTLFDPKKRNIAVAPFRDRVDHHAVVNILEPVFEKRFIFDSYASIKDKGTHRAVARAQTFIRRCPWYAKADVKHYFDTINHDLLLAMMAKKVQDTGLLSLIEKIVKRAGNETTGLPIGNLTSQFFANLYLDSLDHYIKDGLGVRCYLRYMDDFVIFGWSQGQVTEQMKKAEIYCNDKLGLVLKKKALHIGKSAQGLTFLGMGIYPGTIRVRSVNRRRSIHRIYKKHRAWRIGKINEEKLAESMESVMAHLNHFSQTRVRPLEYFPNNDKRNKGMSTS